MVEDVVEHRSSEGSVAAEVLVPLRKRQVASQAHRAMVVALGDDLEEATGGVDPVIPDTASH